MTKLESLQQNDLLSFTRNKVIAFKKWHQVFRPVGDILGSGESFVFVRQCILQVQRVNALSCEQVPLINSGLEQNNQEIYYYLHLTGQTVCFGVLQVY